MKKRLRLVVNLLCIAGGLVCLVLLVCNGQTIISEFNKNIILSGAYVSIAKGLWITVKLTALSAAAAFVTGAVFCAMRMTGIRALAMLSNFISTFFRGVPAVSVLMILFFCVFTSRDTNALFVATVGYGLYSGSYVGEIFRTGLLSVEPQETEAARMLGLTAWEAFISVTLPQAWQNARPVYTDSVISLLQWTSVASYISIVEMTKTVGNLAVRTGNAFFALFLSALLYLALSWLIRGIFSIDRRRRARA